LSDRGVRLPPAHSHWYTPDLDSVVRNVRDTAAADRRALDHVIGRPLDENQQVIIQMTAPGRPRAAARLPDWCNVYAGLSDEQVEAVEAAIRRRSDLTRPSE
jgi:hypothetical protein